MTNRLIIKPLKPKMWFYLNYRFYSTPVFNQEIWFFRKETRLREVMNVDSAHNGPKGQSQEQKFTSGFKEGACIRGFERDIWIWCSYIMQLHGTHLAVSIASLNNITILKALLEHLAQSVSFPAWRATSTKPVFSRQQHLSAVVQMLMCHRVERSEWTVKATLLLMLAVGTDSVNWNSLLLFVCLCAWWLPCSLHCA